MIHVKDITKITDMREVAVRWGMEETYPKVGFDASRRIWRDLCEWYVYRTDT